ncbi:MAG TPA: hypothetical protein VJ875_20805 [Pyrinomonadaceae bacterium]|nr:hypothetical protein [Pyrinomonadaceae bacterium]
MQVIQVSDRPASQRFYAVAGRLLFIESFDRRLDDLIARLFAGWQLAPVASIEREPDIRINFFCDDARQQIPEGLNQFEIADGGRCYTDGEDYYLSLGNLLMHLQNGRPVRVDLWLSELPDPVDSMFARATSFAVCAGLRRFGLFELHSAGVVHPRSGKGLLIIGPSGSGKSTLALRLAMAAWPYLSDDELLLSSVNGEVEARGFRTFFAVREELSSPSRTCFEPDVVLGSGRRTSASTGALVFISLNGEQKSELNRLTQAEAMARLLRSCPWATYDTGVAGAYLELLSRLARQTNAFDLFAGRDLLAPSYASQLLSHSVSLD